MTAFSRTVTETITASSDSVKRALAQTRTPVETITSASDTVQVPAVPTSFLSSNPLALYAQVYDNQNVNWIATIGQILNNPVWKSSLNGGFQPIDLELPSQPPSGVAEGCYIRIFEQGGDSRTVYTGIIEDIPDTYDVDASHTLHITPLVTRLGDTAYIVNWPTGTEVAVIARDIVNRCSGLNYTAASIPITGQLAAYAFTGSCADALDILVKIAGPTYYWFVDEFGTVWIGNINFINAPTFVLKQGADFAARILTASIENLFNYVHVYGGTPSNSSTPIDAIADGTSGSPYPRKELTPPPVYQNCVDFSTLQSIANTLLNQLNRPSTKIELTLPYLGKRVRLGNAVGTTISYWEPDISPLPETYAGSGLMSVTYVVTDVEIDGPVQRIVIGTLAVTADDLTYQLNQMLINTLEGQPSVVSVTGVGNIPPSALGSQVPSIPGNLQVATGIDNVAQTNNAYAFVTWNANPTLDYVDYYEVVYNRVGDPNQYHAAASGTSLKITGLVPGAVYNFQIRAHNRIGNISALTAIVQQTMAVDVTAPATPTGLTAIKSIRGALVSWTPNTEPDLAGYQLQVSVGGGAYTLIDNGPSLSTFRNYQAPSGTAQNTSLTFQVRAVDWSGNVSGWSTASTAVQTDGVIFDELLAGNLTVFGTLTSGGLRTASSGRRLVLDSNGIRLYDGTSTNYGAPSGAGVTVEISSSTGNGFFSGTIAAGSLLTGGIQSSTASHVAAIPSNFTGFQLDATNGLRFYTVGALNFQVTLGGQTTIYSGASMLIQGGSIVNDMSYYQTSWTSRSLMNTSRYLHQTCAVHAGNGNYYVYVMGGKNNSGTLLTSCEYAQVNSDGTLGTWTTATSLPSGVAGSTAATDGSHIWVGGQTTALYYCTINNDGSLSAWSTATTALPSSGGSLAYAWAPTSGNALYYAAPGDTTLHYVAPQVSGNVNTAWASAATIPVTYSDPMIVASYAELYLFETASGAFTPSYSWVPGGGGVWTATPARIPIHDSYGMAATITSDGYLLFAGGALSSTSTTSSRTEYVDGGLLLWSALNVLPNLYYAGAVVAANGFFIFTGGSTGFTPITVATTTATCTMPIPPIPPSIYLGARIDPIFGLYTNSGNSNGFVSLTDYGIVVSAGKQAAGSVDIGHIISAKDDGGNWGDYGSLRLSSVSGADNVDLFHGDSSGVVRYCGAVGQTPSAPAFFGAGESFPMRFVHAPTSISFTLDVNSNMNASYPQAVDITEFGFIFVIDAAAAGTVKAYGKYIVSGAY